MSNKGRGKMDEDDDDFSSLLAAPLLEVYKEVNIQNKYRVFIDEVITGASKYRSVINILESANEGDVVEFRLNTPGGNLMTAIQICNAIENSEATTVAIVDGEVASAGTLFMLACDNVVIMKNTIVMVHPASTGMFGDVKKLRNTVDFQTKFLKDVLYDIYKGFLTDDEFEDMIESSRDIYMRHDEVAERLKTRQQLQIEQVNSLLEDIKESSKTSKTPKKRSKAKKNAS